MISTKHKLAGLAAVFLVTSNLFAQTITGTVLVNEIRNVTSGNFTNNNSFEIQNIGTASLKFFMASTANSASVSGNGVTVASGNQVTVTAEDLGGVTIGTFINVTNTANPPVAGSYVFKINGNKQTVSYETYTQTFYNMDTAVDPMLIPPQEFLMMTPTEMKDLHKEFLTLDNGYIHEITHIFNTEYLEWMELPKKTVITLTGAKTYDENNNVIADEQAANMSPQLQSQLTQHMITNGLSISPRFDTMTAQNMTLLNQNGYTASKTSNGEIHIRKNNFETVINPFLYYTIDIEYDSTNQEVYRMEKTYYRNENGVVVPNDQAEVYHKLTSNYICYQKVIYTSYTKFIISGADVIYNPPVETINLINEQLGDNIKVYPNPAGAVVYVDLPQTGNGTNQLFEVTLQRANNQPIATLHNQNSGTTVSFNIASLFPGTYALKVTWGGETKVIQIVKI